MSPTWRGEAPPPAPPPGLPGRLRALWRGAGLAAVLGLGLAAFLVLRLVEAPLHGRARPWTPWITQGVCRATLAILGIGHKITGTPMTGPGAVVANHASWLDIFALHARKRVFFVSKAEVARWPGIGLLARVTGTVFITRDPRDARAQQALLEDRLTAGHRLLFFPEGTSTDGLRVLPFKTTLFAALHAPGLAGTIAVQPVAVLYTAPKGADPRFYGWWGDMGFGPHLLTVLAAPRQGRVEIRYLPPLPIADYPNRKALAAAAETAVRAAFTERAPASVRPSSPASGSGCRAPDAP